MVMFPNISAITIGILTLYLVAAILGRDFFKGLFNKEHGGYMYIAAGVIGLGSVIFYVGISMGFWDMNPLDSKSQWNVILAVAFLILGILFLVIDMVPFGILLLLVFSAYVYGGNNGDSILQYFIDPVIFIVLLIVTLMSWINTDSNRKDILLEGIESNKKSLKRYKEDYGVKNDYEAVIKDMTEDYLSKKQKRFKKRFGE